MNTLDDKHERRLAAKRRYYAKHAEETKVAAREWRLAHPEEARTKSRESAKRYRAAHRVECNAESRKHSARYRAEHVDEIRATKRKWHERNRERNNQKRHEYYTAHHAEEKKADKIYGQTHRAERTERHRLWCAAHPEEVAKNNAQWRIAHPETVKNIHRRRRARKAGAPGATYTTVQHLEWRRQMWGGRCYLCGAENAAAMDHVIPLAKGGSHWPANQRPICTHCNSSKGAKLLVEYLGLKKVEAVA